MRISLTRRRSDAGSSLLRSKMCKHETLICTIAAMSICSRIDCLGSDLPGAAYASTSMATFHDLPLELLPSILHHLVKPDQLATACLVNKTFYTFAAADLYQIASILPWHKDSKVKVSV